LCGAFDLYEWATTEESASWDDKLERKVGCGALKG
jgi:hypothetical protein